MTGFYYGTPKQRKWCEACDKWKTTKQHFKKTKIDKDGFNKLCTTCEGMEKAREKNLIK